ncbi:MAG: prepilin-type N-terminal cleavage/methylation domain-containing protein [Blastocatellia bacterium]
MKAAQHTRRASRGFSLIELMIVVAIIAIIAAIALPALTNNIKYGREAFAVGTLRTMHGAQASYHSRKGRFGTLAQLTEAELLPDPSFAAGKPVKEYIFTDGIPEPGGKYCIQATRKDDGAAFHDYNITDKGVIYKLKSTTKAPLPPGEGIPESQDGEDAPAAAAPAAK